eukprot:2037108-Rhodomonas_salina.1
MKQTARIVQVYPESWSLANDFGGLTLILHLVPAPVGVRSTLLTSGPARKKFCRLRLPLVQRRKAIGNK